MLLFTSVKVVGSVLLWSLLKWIKGGEGLHRTGRRGAGQDRAGWGRVRLGRAGLVDTERTMTNQETFPVTPM